MMKAESFARENRAISQNGLTLFFFTQSSCLSLSLCSSASISKQWGTFFLLFLRICPQGMLAAVESVDAACQVIAQQMEEFLASPHHKHASQTLLTATASQSISTSYINRCTVPFTRRNWSFSSSSLPPIADACTTNSFHVYSLPVTSKSPALSQHASLVTRASCLFFVNQTTTGMQQLGYMTIR